MAEAATVQLEGGTAERRGFFDFLQPATERYAEGCRDLPEVIHLPVEAGGEDLAPVRIFIGSDTAFWQAERVLVWSIREKRDPKRAYEIHILKELKGFDREGWPSAFAGYRFAVPSFAGAGGRALYLNVGAAFTADPAELVDQDFGEAALLEDLEHPNALMVMDCARLAEHWPIETVRRAGTLEAMGSAAAKVAAPLPEAAAVRLGDWRPLETAADQAGFTIFTKDRPSRRFQDLLALHQEMHEVGRPDEKRGPERTFNGKSLAEHIRPAGNLIVEHGATSILDFGSGKAALYQDHPDHPAGSRFKTMANWPGVTVTCFDPGYPAFAEEPSGPYDGVISTDVVEHIAADDIPWILDDIFSHAKRFVYVVAACFPAKKMLPNGENAHVTIQPPAWWQSQMERAAVRHPGIQWTLCAQTKFKIGPFKRERHLLFRGG